MIRERVATHDIHRPPPRARARCAAHRPCTPRHHLSALGAGPPRRYIASNAGTIQQIARRRECAIALLRSRGSGGRGEGEGEMWSVAWALGDAGERPPPSSLVARCDTAEVLACRPRNALLAAAASVRSPREARGAEKRRARRLHAVGRRASFGGG
ncbi:hypothetical protein V8E53_004386 [Lactarius tabidus]